MKRLLIALLAALALPTSVNANETFLGDKYLHVLDDLKPLLNLLRDKGFIVKFKNPPQKGVFGLFQSKNKTIWISPITYELGIFRQTILHEATHAAQSCPYGLLNPIGLNLPISPFIRKEIQSNLLRNYSRNNFLIEEEAFSLQGQKNAVELLLKALDERCK